MRQMESLSLLASGTQSSEAWISSYVKEADPSLRCAIKLIKKCELNKLSQNSIQFHSGSTEILPAKKYFLFSLGYEYYIRTEDIWDTIEYSINLWKKANNQINFEITFY